MMRDFTTKILKMKLKTGLTTVIENQQGRVFQRKGYNAQLEFFCPICEKLEDVVLECEATIVALKAIGKNPIIQLICEGCNHSIDILNWNINHLDQEDRIELSYLAVYKELGWID